MIRLTISEASVRKLTVHQRNLLIDHIDGEVDVVVHDAHKVQCRNALMTMGFLRGSPSGANRPRATVLTETGRMALALVLGDYADGLVRAGLLEQQSPLLVLQALREAGRSQTYPAKSPNLKNSTKPNNSDSDIGR